jgi:hypothetical protein
MSEAETIRRAFSDATGMRPYKIDDVILKAVIPAGGDWTCEADPGAISYSIRFAGIEAALVNPDGAIDDQTEGQIAMAMRALPAMDCALRAIMALASDVSNVATIAKIAETVIAYVEMPAPPFRRSPG